jgi:putative membrane protein
MVIQGDVRLERLTRYIFRAPSWPFSLGIILIFGLLIDAVSFRIGGSLYFLGSFGFTIPAFIGFFLTKLLINLTGKQITWNRSALLALSVMIIGMIVTLTGLVISVSFLPLFYSLSLGLMFGIRILILVAVADYRISRVLIPAATQTLSGLLLVSFLITAPDFILLGIILHIFFGLASALLIRIIERPMYKTFHIGVLDFVNAFIAHLTDGSKDLEEFFRKMGEEVYVPQVSLFFRRPEKRGVIFTIPNVHPGPMGEIGGGNIPIFFRQAFDDIVMVSHGAATHDFNLVSETEISKLVDAVRSSTADLIYTDKAAISGQIQFGSVGILYQRFGDALLLVSTRSPEKTEDLDVSIGMMIMAEGHRSFPHVGFVDAHNCLTGDISHVMPATLIATEYVQASTKVIDSAPTQVLYPFSVGVSELDLPFTREQGFGDLGIQTLVVRVENQSTAYMLFDGNNMASGTREILRDRLLQYVDNAEVMTTDSHVVNTISGKNPIGMRIPAADLLGFIDTSIQKAISDLSRAEVAASTVTCERVVVFGSQRIAQLASTVNTMLIFIAPLSIAILLVAFLLSIIAYIVIG